MTQADFYEGTHMHTPNFNCQFSFYNKLDRNPIKIQHFLFHTDLTALSHPVFFSGLKILTVYCL